MFTHSFRSTALLALFAGAAILPSASQAQGTDSIQVTAPVAAPVTTESGSTVIAVPSGARLAPVGVTAKAMSYAPVDNTAHMRSTGESVGQNKAMMGVGAIALVVGLVIGGDAGTIIAIGGAAVGLVGLYRYMQ